MDKEQEKEIVTIMKAARARARGYADQFGWAIDRDLEEWGVVMSLNEALKKNQDGTFKNIETRGRGNDPPDCEAINQQGLKTAIEVTELVSEEAIRAYKAGKHYVWADWNRETFIEAVSELITRKNERFDHLKGGPYPGGYVLVIFTDEPLLKLDIVAQYLEHFSPSQADALSKIYFLMFFDKAIGTYPYFKIK